MSKHIIPNANSMPYISNCYLPASAQAGTVWFDSSTQSMQVYDGSTWVSLQPPKPMLSWEAEEALDKIIPMLNGQPLIVDMADKYPLVEEALGQLEVALKLCQNLDGDE